ncbi:MAG: ferritin family protein [Atribacterota bacterium]
MPEFLNPFSGMVPPRKMSTEELLRAIRLNLAAEEEAVHLYLAHADATDNPIAKKVLIDIANEEKVHAGEFLRLLEILAEDEKEFLQQGAREVDELVQERAKPDTPEEPTIGSLR